MQLESKQYELQIIGFVVLTISILIAYVNPAQAYELSIYSGTPIFVWIGIILTLLIGLLLSFKGTTSTVRLQALLLSGMSVFFVVALPLIRGYYHLGEGDAMSHVGRVRDLLAGTSGLMEQGYPAVHTLIIFARQIAGIPIPQSFYYTLYTFIILFFIFIPVVVRSIENRQHSSQIAALLALLLLPINHISVFMQVYPTTQALLFIPVLLYIFTRYLNNDDNRYPVLFILCSVTLILLHPQQAVNFLLLIGTAAAVQFFATRTINDLTHDRSIYIMTSILFISFYGWFQGSRFEGPLRAFVNRLVISDVTAGGEVGERGASLSQLGTSTIEMFTKLFAVSSVFCLLAGGLMVLLVYRWLIRRNRSQNTVLLYLTFGFIPILGMFFAYIVASITTQYFRHLGFMMVIVTIFGAIALARISDQVFDRETAKTALIVTFLILFIPSILVVHPSPYIFQSSGHVSEGQIEGFETAFEHQEEGVEFLHVRSNTDRYEDYHFGETSRGIDAGTVPNHFANQNLSDRYQEPRYLIITGADRKRDPILYQGFRYSQEDFRYLESDPAISRVQSGGGVDLYLVESERRDTTTE